MHIDFVPVQFESQRGLKVQNSQTGALKEMGFKDKTKSNTAQMQWERELNDLLDNLCKEQNINVVHPMREAKEKEKEHSKHLNTYEYKAKKRKELENKINDLQKQLDKKEEKIIDLTKQIEEQAKNISVNQIKYNDLTLQQKEVEKIKLPEYKTTLLNKNEIVMKKEDFDFFKKQNEEQIKQFNQIQQNNLINLQLFQTKLNKEKELIEEEKGRIAGEKIQLQNQTHPIVQQNTKLYNDNVELTKHLDTLKTKYELTTIDYNKLNTKYNELKHSFDKINDDHTLLVRTIEQTRKELGVVFFDKFKQILLKVKEKMQKNENENQLEL